MGHHYLEGTEGPPKRPVGCANCGDTTTRLDYKEDTECFSCNMSYMILGDPDFDQKMMQIRKDRAKMNRPCKNYKRYKGLVYPKCRRGEPCNPCLLKYRQREWDERFGDKRNNLDLGAGI